MRTLVTGAAGFIGSHVVRALLARGHAVRALVLPSDRAPNLSGLEVEIVRGDVRDAEAMARATRNVEVVFHLAAVYALWSAKPAILREVNVAGTRNVLEAARRAGVRRVVHTSSIARFGGQGLGRCATEASPFALGVTGDLYARTKNEAHWVALDAARAGQDVVIVAPTGPIGPGDVGPTPTGRLLTACLSLPVVTVVRTESCFAHVSDMADAHVRAAEVGRAGETYLLGTENVGAADLARRALAILGKRRPVLEVPYTVASAFAHGALAHAELVTRRAPIATPAAVRIARLGLAADCRKAVRELGMRQTPVDVALRDALVWFSGKHAEKRQSS
jgi:dihydroflavonol-4-reductase